MKSTNKYKLVKLGHYWHIMRLYYVGWWIFKKNVWLSEFPCYWNREEAKKVFNKNYKQL